MFSNKSLSHGGNLLFASKEFNRDEFLDFSSNINPMGVPEEFKKLIINNIEKLSSYPNIDYIELKKDIANYIGVEERFILPTNGATEAIYLILQNLKFKKVLMPVPSFSEYDNACRNFDIDVEYYFTKEEEDFKINIDELKEIISDGEVDSVFLCNPNNPTSQLINRNDLLNLLKFAMDEDVFILIDESFIDLIKDEEDYTMRGYIEEFSNLIIIQSFTKFFAVPGIRIGFLMGDPALLEVMFNEKMPWSINYFASLIGCILDKDSDYVKKTKTWINEEVLWFYNELKKFKRIKVFKPNTNFILIKLEDKNLTSHELRKSLGKEGILIRDCSNFKGLNEKFIRVAIKDREKNKKLLEKLKIFIR